MHSKDGMPMYMKQAVAHCSVACKRPLFLAFLMLVPLLLHRSKSFDLKVVHTL